MRFRCAQCRALTPVQIPARLETPLVVPCSGCGRSYRFAVDRSRGSGDQERYRQARAFSETNTIDLASAYSVLEGIMSLEEARALRPGGAKPAASKAPATDRSALEEALRDAIAEETPASSTLPDADSRQAATVRSAVPGKGRASGLVESDVPFDPGFAEAVREGRLTPQQALERGDRRSLAQRLSQRHRLPMELALRVADNRITVQKALLHKAAIESRVPPPAQTSVSHGVWNFMIFTIGALILAGLGVHIYDVWGDYLTQQGGTSLIATPASASARQPAPAPVQDSMPPEPPPALTVPRTDATGQLIEVLGPDPRSVLVAFCRSGRQSGQREPMEISPTVPADAAARWGVFRNLGQLDSPVRAILIRKDARTGRWSAGDGRSPITTVPAPELPPGTRTVPISALRADPNPPAG
jgi:hypothetical protein